MAYNLKPFRSTDEHDVVNLFALNASSGNQGALVSIVGSGFVSTDALSYDATIAGNPSVNDFTSRRWAIPARMGLAASGSKAFGVMLKNVRELDQFGRPLLFDSIRKEEANAVLSGEAVPVLRKGILLISGISGSFAPNSGVKVSDLGNGDYMSCASTDSNKIGTILGMPDTDGFVAVSINCY